MSTYPKYLYHHTDKPIVVKSKDAHEALGSEWVESPAHVVKPEPKDESAEVPAPKASKKVK